MAKGQCDLIQNYPEAASEAGLGLSTSGSTGKPEPHSPLDRPHPAVATDRGMLAKTEPPPGKSVLRGVISDCTGITATAAPSES